MLGCQRGLVYCLRVGVRGAELRWRRRPVEDSRAPVSGTRRSKRAEAHVRTSLASRVHAPSSQANVGAGFQEQTPLPLIPPTNTIRLPRDRGRAEAGGALFLR